MDEPATTHAPSATGLPHLEGSATGPSAKRVSLSLDQTQEERLLVTSSAAWQLLDTSCRGVLHQDTAHVAKRLVGISQGARRSGADSGPLLPALLCGGSSLPGFLDAVHECRQQDERAAVLGEIRDVCSCWYTDTKWQKVHVAYAKLFLPILHIAIALFLAAEQLSGDLNTHVAILMPPGRLQRLLELVGVSNQLLSLQAIDWVQQAEAAGFSLWYFYLAFSLAVPVVVLGTLYSRIVEQEPEVANLNDLLHGLKQESMADSLQFSDVDGSFVTRLLRPISHMNKPWQFAAVGFFYTAAIVFADVDYSTFGIVQPPAAPPASWAGWGWGRGLEAAVQPHTDDLKSSRALVLVMLAQYAAFCVVFLLVTLTVATEAAPDFLRSWEMDKAMLAQFKFDIGSNTEAAHISALQVYHWLLRAQVPTDFEVSTVFWDSVKRYLFTPACLLYSVMPVAIAAQMTANGSPALRLRQLPLAAALSVPNVVTAFLFQSLMISVAAVVGRKLEAVKGLSYMLSPLHAIVAGLPVMRLQLPRSLAAWLRLREFVHASFEFPDMVRVEAGFYATLVLLLALQVALFTAVSAASWPLATLVLYYYLLCTVYGFGAFVVGMNTLQEHRRQPDCLERVRLEYLANCYLSWDEPQGDPRRRSAAKEISDAVREVVCNMRVVQAQKSGIALSPRTVIAVRMFMILMTLATVARLPFTAALYHSLAASPVFAHLKQMHFLMGPLLSALGGL